MWQSAARRNADRQPRGLTAEDLAGLRDIGPQYPAGSDRNLFSISPDGQWLAFEIHRANPDTNDYCVALAALPIARVDDRTPQLLDLGGELIPATFRQYGWAALPSGMPMPISPHWAPEGRWIAFLKREHGSTQVWRAICREARADKSRAAAAMSRILDLPATGERSSLPRGPDWPRQKRRSTGKALAAGTSMRGLTRCGARAPRPPIRRRSSILRSTSRPAINVLQHLKRPPNSVRYRRFPRAQRACR